MENSTKLLILAAWIPQAMAQIIAWSYRLQEKEYRFDKFKVLLKSSTGVEKLFLGLILLKFAALLVSPIALIPLGLYLILDVYFFKMVIAKKLPRPVVTKRVRNILLTTIVGLFILLVLGFLNIIRFETMLLLAETYLIIGLILGTILTKPLVEKAKKEDIKKARAKLKTVKPKVIGITGSYGKTTTKEFLYQLLTSKYKVEKSSKNQNNEFGIARKVISDFDKRAEIFIAEMGAYKKGEIAAIADFTNPTIAIITGIEEQHLELFGSLENIITAKFELIDALPKNAIAVFNTTNPYCEEMADKAQNMGKKLVVLRYKVDKNKSKNIDAFSTIVSSSNKEIVFDIQIANITKRLKTSVAGVHFIENLTGAILVARKLGVPWKSIEKVCKKLETQPGTMNVFETKSNAMVIDDSYNSTPKGFTSAFKYLAEQKRINKIIITPGIIELAGASQKVHENLGELISQNATTLVLTNRDFLKAFTKGFGDKTNNLLALTNPNDVIDLVNKFNNKDTAILLEGRLPTKLIKYIESLYK